MPIPVVFLIPLIPTIAKSNPTKIYWLRKWPLQQLYEIHRRLKIIFGHCLFLFACPFDQNSKRNLHIGICTWARVGMVLNPKGGSSNWWLGTAAKIRMNLPMATSPNQHLTQEDGYCMVTSWMLIMYYDCIYCPNKEGIEVICNIPARVQCLPTSTAWCLNSQLQKEAKISVQYQAILAILGIGHTKRESVNQGLKPSWSGSDFHNQRLVLDTDSDSQAHSFRHV